MCMQVMCVCGCAALLLLRVGLKSGRMVVGGCVISRYVCMGQPCGRYWCLVERLGEWLVGRAGSRVSGCCV